MSRSDSVLWGFCAACALSLFVGCSSTVTLSMPNIDEPVMLNDLTQPVPGPRNPAAVSASVERGSSLMVLPFFGNPKQDTRDREATWYKDELEAHVYEKIGGVDSMAISNAEITVRGWWLELLFYRTNAVMIDFDGIAIDLDAATDGASQ